MKRRWAVLRGGARRQMPCRLAASDYTRFRAAPMPGQQSCQALRGARRGPVACADARSRCGNRCAVAIGKAAARQIRCVDRTCFCRSVFTLRTPGAGNRRRKRLVTEAGRQDDRPKRQDQPIRGTVSHDRSPPGSIAELRGNAGSPQSINGDRLCRQSHIKTTCSTEESGAFSAGISFGGVAVSMRPFRKARLAEDATARFTLALQRIGLCAFGRLGIIARDCPS